MEANGANVLLVVTDVSKLDDVEALARKTLDTFGAIHLLFNNAGVTPIDYSVWRSTIADWKWIWESIYGESFTG